MSEEVLTLPVDNTWFTSDLHFGHLNIIKYCNRPFKDVDHMNHDLIKNFAEALDEHSILINLGDVTMNHQRFLWAASLIPGHHYLVPGNHDGIWPAHKMAKRHETYEVYDLIFEMILGLHTEIDLDGTRILLSHLPYVGDAWGKDKHLSYRPQDQGLPLVCGHVHDAWKYLDRQFNVGVDVNDFKPVPASRVLDWARSLSE